MKTACRAGCCGIAAMFFPNLASATLGVYEYGYGIKSMGMGGVAYAYAGDTMSIAANPAHAVSLAGRYDIGYDVFNPRAGATIRDVPGVPDQTYYNDGRSWYGIPQGGVAFALSDRLAAGVTMISAGLGPDYKDSPYARYGGASRVILGLAQTALGAALAYEITPRQNIGFSANISYQALSTKGLEAFAQASESPEHVTNQGRDGVVGGSVTVGWVGELAPGLTAGASYHSKNWMPRHKEYEGLLPDHGKFELPAIWGAGFVYQANSDWMLAFDYQRFEYASEVAFGNGIDKLSEGKLLGSKDGPGFGWNDQDAYKFGVNWKATPQLDLRAGYVHATQIIRESDTLFAFLGCVTLTTHYSVGATYDFGGWDLSGYYSYVPKQTVYGENSIPAAFGGGEADISDRVHMFGVSFGRRFGG